jgi:hypothetical protein
MYENVGALVLAFAIFSVILSGAVVFLNRKESPFLMAVIGPVLIAAGFGLGILSTLPPCGPFWLIVHP